MATRWGILSAGLISHDFVSALRTLPTDEHQLIAVAARDLQSAKQFAQLHGIPKAYGTYDELANDPDIQVVYIGTIHPHHLSTAKLMLAGGKHVLVEKPMTLNSKGTDELIASARRSGLFLMEALWSRFLPSYEFVMKTITDGVIGDVLYVNVTFGMPMAEVDRMAKRVLGGGTILDVGIYAINIIEMVYNGETPEEIRAVGHLNADGVDESVVAALKYSGGRTASISTNSRVELPCEAIIVGTKGVLRIPMPFWCVNRVYLNNVAYEFPLPELPEPCNFYYSAGLRYEAIEVRKCLTTSSLESQVMSHKDSQLLAKIMDELRRQVGVKYDVDD